MSISRPLCLGPGRWWCVPAPGEELSLRRPPGSSSRCSATILRLLCRRWWWPCCLCRWCLSCRLTPSSADVLSILVSNSVGSVQFRIHHFHSSAALHFATLWTVFFPAIDGSTFGAIESAEKQQNEHEGGQQKCPTERKN